MEWDVSWECLAEPGGWVSPTRCPVGNRFILASLFYPVESGLGGKLLIASGGRAMFFHSPFESLQFITIAAYSSQDRRNWLLAKCLMKGTEELFFPPFPSYAPVSVCSLLTLFLLLFLYVADACCRNFPLELSLRARCEKQNRECPPHAFLFVLP